MAIVHGTPVTSVLEFKAKYGTQGASLVMRSAAANLPEGSYNLRVAEVLGEISADLEFALRQLK